MSINKQQAKVISRNTRDLVANGGSVSPKNIGEDWSRHQCRWDVRNAQLNTRDWEATLANLTYLTTSGYRGKTWHPAERLMQDAYFAYSEYMDTQRRLDSIMEPGSLATPEGVLMVAHERDRLREAYEAALEAADEAKMQEGWELFSHPSLA